jgi:hypothetical protein
MPMCQYANEINHNQLFNVPISQYLMKKYNYLINYYGKGKCHTKEKF